MPCKCKHLFWKKQENTHICEIIVLSIFDLLMYTKMHLIELL